MKGLGRFLETPVRWYKKAARLEADRSVELPARAYRRGRGIVLNQYGLASFFALCVMVLFCINYSSNAGLICACLLTVAWTCAILANHWVVSKVVLQRVVVLPGDEDNPGQVEMLWNITSSVRPVFWLTIDGQVARLVFDEHGWARVRWQPLPRQAGRYDFPTVRVSTSWPMSIGFSWFILRPAHSIVIAPCAPAPSSSHGSHGEESPSLASTSGDPEGIRPRNPQDFSAKWAWKPTARLGKPMTYEWSQAGKEVVHVFWDDDLEPAQALRKLRADLHRAVENNQPYQITHPWGKTPVLSGPRPALSQVCQIGARVLSSQPWGPGVPFQPGMFTRLIRSVRKQGGEHG